MKAMIPEGLISTYDITVPYAFDIRKLRKRLDAELEKLHPCFPERCAVDYRLRFQTYGKRMSGVHIRALVMDRLQLAALKKENEGCVLYAGGVHPYPVFMEPIRQRRLLFLAAALLALVPAFFFVRHFRVKTDIALSTAVQPADKLSTDTLISAPTEADLQPVLPAVQDFTPFVNNLYEQGGSVSACSWNAGDGTLTLTVTGLFPEQLPETQYFGPVSYREGVPEMQVTLVTPFVRTMQSVLQTVPSERVMTGSVVAAVRELILEQGGTLASETVSPPSLTGTVPEKAWLSFALVLQKVLCCTENGGADAAPVRQLELVRDSGRVTISLSLNDVSAGQFDELPLPFSDLGCVFTNAAAPTSDASAETEWEAALAKGREIGRITREDGSAVVFFHGDDGKIERRVYEN